ncbi:MAG TPA: hypothetical protein VN903_35690, partial [Polyangia bacterium]|nr:hypothetical protein [Polyangia bacterium]
GFAPAAHAATTAVPPGGSLALDQDLVLSGTDELTASASGSTRCAIDGQGHSIVTMEGWTGRIAISGCDLQNLGTADKPGVNVVASGDGATFDVQDSVFESSGQIAISAVGAMTFAFRDNTLAESGLVPIDLMLYPNARAAFVFTGPGGPSQKLFQGNRVLHSWVEVGNGNNWLIGGPSAADGNVLIGVRGGAKLDGSAIVVQGNYIRPTKNYDHVNQLAAFYGTGRPDSPMVIEHNVIRSGNWMIREVAHADLRYNLLGDPYAVSWVLASANADVRVHHNVLVRNNKLVEANVIVEGFRIGPGGPTDGPSVSFYNNTMDGSGKCYDWMKRAVSVDELAVVQSLRSNAFINFPANDRDDTALVGPGQNQDYTFGKKGDPGPARLAYADYNLFYNPDAVVRDNYGISVDGAQERVTPGFALHDAESGGAKDQQDPPQYTGPLPVVFPFGDDDQIVMGNVTVCQILAFYRKLYTPAEGSPLIDTGDPADGAGNDIGAIGAGVPAADDLFGTFCSDAERDLPNPPTIETKCPSPITSGSGTGGIGGNPPPPGFMCVCDESATAPGALPLTILAALLALALFRVRRARRR